MCAPWFHTFQLFPLFLLFRPPSYLHKLQSSACNYEDIGKLIWKYIELFDSMKNDNSYHSLKFVQIKCNLIMIFNLVNKIEPICHEFGSKTLNVEKRPLSKIWEISKNVKNFKIYFHLCPWEPFCQNRSVFANQIIEP